jgi:DNA-binding beta-propeller fold protein YncE
MIDAVRHRQAIWNGIRLGEPSHISRRNLMGRNVMRQTLRAAGLLAVLAAMAGVHPRDTRAADGAYKEVDNWAQLPKELNSDWGEVAGVDVDGKGNVYAFLREPSPRILVFDANGKFLRTMAQDAFDSPHSLRILRDGNIWLADRRLQQIFKYDTAGKLLWSLGQKGVVGDENSKTTFHNVADMVLAPNGDIFVADGEGGNNRIVKFSKDGTFVKSWGTRGSGQGQFQTPHCIAIDATGRVWVCDRNNNRIQVFDQDGKFLEEMKQFGTPVSIAFAKDNKMYVAASPGDAMSIGTVDGKVIEKIDGLSNPHGIAVDPSGSTIYVAETMGRSVVKFVRK